MADKIKALYFSLLLLLFINYSVSAHGLGNEIRKEVNGFLFEFDIENLNPKTGEKVAMGFSFHNSSTELPFETDNLWVRISKNDKIFFSTNDFAFKKEGPVSFTFLFPESGNYTIDIAAKYGKRDLAASFSVEVQDSIEKYILPIVLIIILMLLIFFKRKLFPLKKKIYLHSMK